jgi:flavin-dependent dehydrogenase
MTLSRTKKDLIVVGAGPAGCAAAITAARTGASVLLLERGEFPRHRVCGEFVSAESVDLLQNLLAPAHRSLIDRAPRISRSRIFVDGSVLRAEITPSAASITRFDLDVTLWDSCAEVGVECRPDCAVQSVEGTGPFRVTTQAESFEARALINATGRWSNLTSAAIRARVTSGRVDVNRASVNKDRWLGVKAHFREVAASPSVDLYFFDGGYCGVQPVSPPSQNGIATVVNACAMVRADVATDLAEVLKLHPALRDRSQTWQPLMDPVSTSPLVFHPPEPVAYGMLQVGDSATFVDPFIGDGISLALRSGDLAAKCLSGFFHDECSLESAAADYTRLYQSHLAPVFRASTRLRNLLRWPGVVRKPVLSILEKTPAITRHWVKMTRVDSHRL